MIQRYTSGARLDIPSLKRALTRYDQHVPDSLVELDKARYEDIPRAVDARIKASEAQILEKDEAVRLVEWKLKHGTFRPRLLQLISSNTQASINDAVLCALHLLSPADSQSIPKRAPPVEPTAPAPDPNVIDPSLESTRAPHPFSARHALDALCVLRGVGPATASLLLSVLCPTQMPFYSDEMFRFFLRRWHDPAPGHRKGDVDWSAGVEYSAGWFESLFSSASGHRSTSEAEFQAVEGTDEGLTMLELERAIWVLGREATGKSVKGKEKEGKDQSARTATGTGRKGKSATEKAPVETTTKASTTAKRFSDGNAKGDAAETSGPRRSKRQRKT